MQGIFSQSVALVAAILLALPPGICCGLNGAAVSASPAASACCHTRSPAQSQPAPAQPTTNCCCTVKAATATSSVQAPDSASTGSLVFELPSANPCSDAACSAAPAVVFTGPPLRILQCVWRI